MEDGNNSISFVVSKPNGKKVEIETNYKKNLSIENRQKLRSIHGVNLNQ
jgi:hypothetical protein